MRADAAYSACDIQQDLGALTTKVSSALARNLVLAARADRLGR